LKDRAIKSSGFVWKAIPAVLKKVYEQAGKILIFADFAGRMRRCFLI